MDANTKVAVQTAVQTVQALLPTILTAAGASVSPQVTALITLLPAFVNAANQIQAANGATPEQLASMFAAIAAGVESDHQEWVAMNAADAAKQAMPSTLKNQAG